MVIALTRLPNVRYITVTDYSVTVMSTAISQNGNSTKNLILKAAFSFYKETMTRDFSMNELAAKVGLSKPAIYRHFKNKEAVLEAMKISFFDSIAEKFNECDLSKKLSGEEHGKKIIEVLLAFFVQNPQFINYFIYQLTLTPDFLKTMRDEICNRGVSENLEFFNKSEKKIFYSAHDYFFGISILFFIKVREKHLKLGENVKDVSYFSSHLYDFLHAGFRGLSRPGEEFYPVEISKERLSELESLCRTKPEDFPPEDKIFKAIASVIRKYTVNGVTIERIAGELGMAKSSLYFYFENKNQMVYSLVKKEIEFLAVLCQENSLEAKNLSEFIYISMLIEINFFLNRSSLLTICGWLLQTSTEEPFDDKPENSGTNSVWDKVLESFSKRVDLGFEFKGEVLRFWLGILPVAITVLKWQNNFDDEKIVEAVKYIFGFVQNGISAEKK